MKPNRTSIIQTTDHIGDLFNALTELKTTAEAQQFFQDLCTPAEIQAMVDRWRVVPLLKAGKSYRQIHDETKVSVTTIGRVARSLLLGKGGYHLIYQRLMRKQHANRKIKQKS